MDHRMARCASLAMLAVGLGAVAAMVPRSVYSEDSATSLSGEPEAKTESPISLPDGLRWAAPPLKSPTTIRLGTGQTSNKLDPKRDYIVVLPAEKKVGVTELIGGRNVVIVGGHVTVAGSEPLDSPKVGHFSAFHLKHQTGTVHIEGVLIDNSAGGKGWDAFFTNCPKAVVQIQNVRVEGLSGESKGHHADIAQIGNGVGELRIDRLTGTSDYQGLFLKIEENLRGQKRFGPMTFSRMNLRAIPGDFNQALLFLTTPDYYMEGDVTLQEVYLQPAPNYAVNYIVPRVSPCGLEQMRSRKCEPRQAWKDGDRITWPFFEKVHGSIIEGAPEHDFVPAGTAGVGYQASNVEPQAVVPGTP
jgi:hypothetical protein